MNLPWLNKLTDWNPQLFREIKGRCKPRNMGIAAGLSLFGQLLLMMSLYQRLPFTKVNDSLEIWSKYCTGINPNDPKSYYRYNTQPCLIDGSGNFIVNWDLWWYDMFLWLSFSSLVVMLGVGTYMLINDLANEERRGTLNFLRLTPQSSQSILLGKMLGVPVLVYLAALMAAPLHFWAGLEAGMSLSRILMYDGAVVACGIFFFSGAMLFGLLSSWMGGFQAWLGSGLVLSWLWMCGMKVDSGLIENNASDIINLFNPWFILPYMISPIQDELPQHLWVVSDYFRGGDAIDWEWFYLPIGASFVALVMLMGLNFAMWTYWMWHGLNRRFPNPGATWLSKSKSYVLVASFELLLLGCGMQTEAYWEDNFNWVLVSNLLVFLGTIASISPQRQTLIDWARYRHTAREQKSKGLWGDLIWGEKSPAPVAILLNLLGLAAILSVWLVLFYSTDKYIIERLVGLITTATIIAIYAVIAQLILLSKIKHAAIWATAVIGSSAFLMPFILMILSLEAHNQPLLWLFTGFSWLGIEHITSITNLLLAFTAQITILGGLSWKLRQQLNQAGESATKALLASQR
ncbi:MAG TPA: ABC transporter permease [Oscillatoriaceae cyanobacterium M33_DOE_052]|uniref:ABC transporter permease n=1 Tax=Planktothricoides sp. SpSt-374 TaxID=2282167 RepID=A0A7C3ZT66_9CYAN|nr:ABC transporter permease [Oscillatoriaceae cyanobacterium M33_DOE_052]